MLIYATELDFIDIVQWLIDNKANLDLKNGQRKTALMIAVLKNHLEIATLLIQNNTDVNIKNKLGQTPLDIIKILKKGQRAGIKIDKIKKLIESKE